MKKIFLHSLFSLIVFTYVFSSVGVRLVAHYCGGSLEKISLFSKPDSCCDGEDEQTDDCCTNDTKHVSFQKDFTFYTLVSDCKAPVQQLVFIGHTRLSFVFENTPQFLFLVKRQSHPPDLVQDEIVHTSVLRI